MFSGSGGSDDDYIDISKYGVKGLLRKVFARSGFAKRIGDEYKLRPCPLGTFVNSSVSESSDLTCLECPAGMYIYRMFHANHYRVTLSVYCLCHLDSVCLHAPWCQFNRRSAEVTRCLTPNPFSAIPVVLIKAVFQYFPK